MAALLASGSLFAAGAGVLGAEAITGTSQQTPTKTTTISVENGATGATGPAGPPGESGPQGPAGSENCPAGSTFQAVVVSAPQGHIEMWVCVAA